MIDLIEKKFNPSLPQGEEIVFQSDTDAILSNKRLTKGFKWKNIDSIPGVVAVYTLHLSNVKF